MSGPEAVASGRPLVWAWEKLRATTQWFTRNGLIPFIIFLLIWGIFVSLRLRFQIILTDTDFYMTGPRVFSWRTMLDIWRDNPPSWYRPVDTTLFHLVLAFLWKNFAAIILLQMLTPAASAVLLYFVAKELSNGNRLIALASTIIYSFSLGVIEISWLFVHKSIVTDFLVLCTVLGYLRYTKTRSPAWFALMVFGGLTAPWAREIAGAVTGALFGATLLQRRRDVKLLGTLFVLGVHGVFPALLTNLVLFQKVRMMSIFERSSWGFGVPFGSHPTFDVPFKTILYLSPIATILMLASIVLFSFRRGRRPMLICGVLVAISMASLIALFYPQSNPFTAIMALLFATTIVAVNLPRDKLLPLWFVLGMIPFIIMPAHDAWLRLAAMPYILMALLWIAELPANLRAVLAGVPIPEVQRDTWSRPLGPGSTPLTRTAALVFAILVLVAANNLLVSFTTFRETIAGNQRMASWATKALPEAAAVMSSVRLLPEVQYYSHDWIDARYIRLPFTFPLPGGQSPALGRLDAVVLSHDDLGVYLMVGEKFGRIGYPEGISDNELRLVKTFVISAKYPMLDPFQAFMPERYRRYGGPTDTLHEFRLIHKLFGGEARAVFHFYRLDRHPQVVESGYKGFNLIQWGNMVFGIRANEDPFAPRDMLGARHGVVGFGRSVIEAKRSIDEILTRTENYTAKSILWEWYAGFKIFFFDRHFYAIPQSEQSFSFSRYQAGGYPEAFDAGAPDLLKLQIDDMYLTGLPPYAPHDYHPSLVVTDYKGFSIYFYRGRIYGTPRSEGAFDYERFATYDYSVVVGPFQAHADTVMWHIDSGRYTPQSRHLAKGFHGYDLVAYGNLIYAIPVGEGPFDYRRFKRNGYTKGFVGGSLDEVKEAVLLHVSKEDPVVAEEYAGFTIAAYRGAYYAVPSSGQESLNALRLQAGNEPLLRGTSRDEVRTLVAEQILRAAPLMIVSDDGEQDWATESGVTASEERNLFRSGRSSLKISWLTSSGSVYYNFTSKQDWTKAHIVGLYVYGAGSGASLALQIRFNDQGGPNWADFRWKDDFTGWRAMVFELRHPTTTSGVVDWTDVRQVVIRPLDATGFSLYVDRLGRDGAEPLMVRTNYLGFDISQHGSKYYATRSTEGNLDLGKLRAGHYTEAISGDSLEEVMELIVRRALGKAHQVVYDDELVWKAEPGVLIAGESPIARHGRRSLTVAWNNSSAAAYYNLRSQDWSSSRFLIMWVHGSRSGENFVLQIRFKDQGGSDWVDYRWNDNFKGWRPIVFELAKPNMTSGIRDWTDVRQVLLRPLSNAKAILYFDYFARL